MRVQRSTRSLAAAALAVVAAVAAGVAPVAAVAQEAMPTGAPVASGLLRPGFEIEPQGSGRSDGFIVYDARLALTGTVGFLFDYELGVEYDRDDPGIDVLDAFASVPFSGGALHADLGAFTSSFGREATTDKADLAFVERSQSALALAPGRQLGVQVRTAALDTRLHAAVGLFNGNGLRFENDDGAFLVAGRASFNNVGDLEFSEDLVWELGAGLAWSSDSALSVLPTEGPAGPEPGEPDVVRLEDFEGDRFLWGVDGRVAYQGWTLAAEYVRATYDLESGGTLDAEGLAVDLRHALWGIFDVGGRYDALTPAAGPDGMAPSASRYLLLGAGVTPGISARISLQYAIGLDQAPRGVDRAIDGTNTAPPLADGQFLVYLQIGF